MAVRVGFEPRCPPGFKWTRSQMSDSDEEFGVGPARPVSRRLRWSAAERLRIVAESCQPGVSVSLVTRRNDVNANLLFTWRRRYGKRAAGAAGTDAAVARAATQRTAAFYTGEAVAPD